MSCPKNALQTESLLSPLDINPFRDITKVRLNIAILKRKRLVLLRQKSHTRVPPQYRIALAEKRKGYAMRKERVNISEESMAQKECRHYWIIGVAAGPVSVGVCRFCGAQRKFGNYLRDCLEIDEEEYQEWAEGRRYGNKERNPENILSEGRGGERDAVTAGT